LQQAKGEDAFLSFPALVKEVTFHAERMNIPQISQTAPVSANRTKAASPLVVFNPCQLQHLRRIRNLIMKKVQESSKGNDPVENSTTLAISQIQITPAAPKPAF